jgi:hypothetical protein
MFSSSPSLTPAFLPIGGPTAMHMDPFLGVHETMLLGSLTAKVPDNWTSVQVALFVAQQATANSDIVTATNNWGLSDFDRQMAVLNSTVTAFNQASNAIAEALTAGVETAVSLVPGGALAVSLNCLAERRYLQAALGVIAVIPSEGIINGINSLRIEINFGGQAVRVPLSAAKVLKTFTPADLSAMNAELKGIKTVEEVEGLVARLAARPLELVPIANATNLSEAEVATAERFMAKTGTTLYEGTPGAEDFLDVLGRTYDACGQEAGAQNGNITQFCNSILAHVVRKTFDFTIVDLTGYSAEQIVEVREFILDNVSKAMQAKIVPIGFTL